MNEKYLFEVLNTNTAASRTRRRENDRVNKKYPQELSLDIADNKQKRSYGLMNRRDMKPNSGMLFIWKDSQIRNFWMKNTHFNLDLF